MEQPDGGGIRKNMIDTGSKETITNRKEPEAYRVRGLITAEEIEAFRPLLPEAFDRSSPKGRFLLGAFSADSRPAGVCWYCFTGFEYELIFLGVSYDHRRKGVGTRLLHVFLSSLYAMGMVFPVRVLFDEKESEDFSRFLLSQGNFFFTEESLTFRITRSDRENSRILQRLSRISSDAKLYFEQSSRIRRQFLMGQHRKKLHFLDELEKREAEFEKELCFCSLRENRIDCVLLIRRTGENARELYYLYADEKEPAHEVHLQHVLAAAVQAIQKNCPDTELLIQTVNGKSEKLMKKLFSESNPVSGAVRCALWDFSLRKRS